MKIIKYVLAILFRPIRLLFSIYVGMNAYMAGKIYKAVSNYIEVKITSKKNKTERLIYQRFNKRVSRLSDIFIEIGEKNIRIVHVESKLFQVLSTVITLSLMKAVSLLIAKNVENNNENEALRSAVVGMLIIKRAQNISKAYFIIGLSVIIYYVAVYHLGLEYGVTSLAVFLLLFFGIFINQIALKYRVVNQLYGDNAYEAREIIEFIEDNFKDNDFTDGSGGIKKLYPDELESDQESLLGTDAISDAKGA